VPSPRGGQIQCPPGLMSWRETQALLTPQPYTSGQCTRTKAHTSADTRHIRKTANGNKNLKPVRRHKDVSGVSVGSNQSTASFYGTSRHESHIIINVDNPTEALRESEFCPV